MGVGPLPFFRFPERPRLAVADIRTFFAALPAQLYRGWTEDADRRPLWLPIGLGTGIAIYFALPVEPALSIGIGFGLAGFLVAAAAAASGGNPGWRATLAMTAAILIGFGAVKLRTETVAAPVLSYKIGPLHFDARIVSADAHGKGTRLVLDVDRIRRLVPSETPRRVRLSVRMPPDDLVPGQWVAMLAVLMPPPEPSSPGGYDFGRWAYYQRIGAVGYAYGKAKTVAPVRPETLMERAGAWLENLRDRMTARINTVIPGARGAIAAALITGKRGGIDPDDQAAFRDAGLAHVLAISGLHLALAGGFFFWIVRALLALFPSIALVYPIKKWAAVAALLGSGAYLVISGCGAPAVRSYIMLAVMFTAILFDRPALSMRSIALAAALILFWKPESLIEPGFEMSFAAVIGLIALAEWESARRARNPGTFAAPGILGRIWRYGIGIALTSTVAGLATAPFAIFHFDRASQYGLIGNLLALPVVGFVIMPAATAAMVLMPFGLDRWALVVMGKGVGAMLAVAQWVAHLPGAADMVPAWPAVTLLLAVAGGLWIALWRQRWRWLGLAPIMVGLVVAGLTKPPDVLVAHDARTVAVRLADRRLHFLRPPKDNYAAESWLKRDGNAHLPDDAVAVARNGVRCDSYGCVAHLPGGLTLASALRFDALPEDCANTDIVVSAVPVRGMCRGPKLVIDRFDLARNGATVVRLGSTLDISTVREDRGERPWSIHSEHRRHGNFRKPRFNSGG